jgi:hypothetical protein
MMSQEHRTEQFNVRLSVEEHARLSELARSQRVSRADILRAAVLRPQADVLADAARDLHRRGYEMPPDSLSARLAHALAGLADAHSAMERLRGDPDHDDLDDWFDRQLNLLGAIHGLERKLTALSAARELALRVAMP